MPSEWKPPPQYKPLRIYPPKGVPGEMGSDQFDRRINQTEKADVVNHYLTITELDTVLDSPQNANDSFKYNVNISVI